MLEAGNDLDRIGPIQDNLLTTIIDRRDELLVRQRPAIELGYYKP